MKRTVRLTERELRNMIAESVRRALNESSEDLWQELRDAKENGADAREILDIMHRLESALEDEGAFVVGGPYEEDMLVKGSPKKLGWRSTDPDFGMEVGKDNKKRPHKGYERGWEK